MNKMLVVKNVKRPFSFKEEKCNTHPMKKDKEY